LLIGQYLAYYQAKKGIVEKLSYYYKYF